MLYASAQESLVRLLLGAVSLPDLTCTEHIFSTGLAANGQQHTLHLRSMRP